MNENKKRRIALFIIRPLFKKFTQQCETYEPTNCCLKNYLTCVNFIQRLVGSYASQCCVKFLG